MRILSGIFFIGLSANVFAAKIEIKHQSGMLQDDVSKRNACAKAMEQLKRKLTQSCADLEGSMTGEWKFEINHTGYYQKKCILSGSGICEVGF